MARLRPYQRPWVDHDDRESTIRAASSLLRFALRDPDMNEVMLRHVLRDSLWAVTEVGGKYTTRFRSRGVLGLDSDQWQAQLRHDHVLTRKALADRIRSGEDPEAVLREAMACVVTKEEHDRLIIYDATKSGWARYRAAGIEVVDMATGESLDLPE